MNEKSETEEKLHFGWESTIIKDKKDCQKKDVTKRKKKPQKNK